MAVNIVIVEDSTLVRKGLVSIINTFNTKGENGFQDPSQHRPYHIVADVAAPKELLSVLSEDTQVDVILLDYSLNVENNVSNPLHALDGQNLIRWLARRYPRSRIIVVSSHRSPVIVRIALEAGAQGYLSKDTTEDMLEQAIQSVMNNETFVEYRLLKDLLNREVSDTMVSPKEIEVLRLICKGYRLTDIAASMNLSIKTVSAHKRRAMQKLGVTSDLELYRVITEMTL